MNGLSLPLGHAKVKTVKKGIKKANVDAGNQPKLRGLLRWEMIKELEGCAVDWRVGGNGNVWAWQYRIHCC